MEVKEKIKDLDLEQAEESMASDLHLFFDSSADMNADIDIVYGIAAGIIVMFEKISMKHD